MYIYNMYMYMYMYNMYIIIIKIINSKVFGSIML